MDPLPTPGQGPQSLPPVDLSQPVGAASPPPAIATPAPVTSLPPALKVRENLQSGPEKVVTSAINFLRKHRVALITCGAMVAGVIALGLATAAAPAAAAFLFGAGVVLLGLGFGGFLLSSLLDPVLDRMLDMIFQTAGLGTAPSQAVVDEYQNASRALESTQYAAKKDVVARYLGHEAANTFEARATEIQQIRNMAPEERAKLAYREETLVKKQVETLDKARNAVNDHYHYSQHVGGLRYSDTHLGIRAMLAVADIFRPLGDYYWQRLADPKTKGK